MNTPITFREYQNQDFNALADIVRKTWKYDEFCSPRAARALGRIYLNSCLANQTFTQVALRNGVPSGIIMCKNMQTYRPRLKYRLRLAGSIAAFLMSKDGRAASRLYKDIDRIDRDLLDNCKETYDGEIAFFAVDSECRGLGIGKQLFEAALRYMEKQQIRRFFLFTDTSCNYGFYEHQGLVRRSQIDQTFHFENQDMDMSFFLYDNIRKEICG